MEITREPIYSWEVLRIPFGISGEDPLSELRSHPVYPSLYIYMNNHAKCTKNIFPEVWVSSFLSFVEKILLHT